jgi:uncharacterized membrane protein HdeD (DUF308 family)
VAWVFGVWLIFYGVMQIVVAFKVKNMAEGAARAPGVA